MYRDLKRPRFKEPISPLDEAQRSWDRKLQDGWSLRVSILSNCVHRLKGTVRLQHTRIIHQT